MTSCFDILSPFLFVLDQARVSEGKRDVELFVVVVLIMFNDVIDGRNKKRQKGYGELVREQRGKSEKS